MKFNTLYNLIMENLTNVQRETLDEKTSNFIRELSANDITVSNSVSEKIKEIVEFGTDFDIFEKLSRRIKICWIN